MSYHTRSGTLARGIIGPCVLAVQIPDQKAQQKRHRVPSSFQNPCRWHSTPNRLDTHSPRSESGGVKALRPCLALPSCEREDHGSPSLPGVHRSPKTVVFSRLTPFAAFPFPASLAVFSARVSLSCRTREAITPPMGHDPAWAGRTQPQRRQAKSIPIRLWLPAIPRRSGGGVSVLLQTAGPS